jgi:DNA-binding NarL/FixJ family response regulator
VLVLDYHLDGAHNGLWLAGCLATLRRAPSVLIYSAFADEALAVAAIVAGADGLLGKRALGGELCSVIRRLASGRRSLPSITRAVARAMGSRLVPHDEAILGMLLHGVEPEQIMERLAISASELACSRRRMLLTLAPRIARPGPLAGELAPLDYEPIRSELSARSTRQAQSGVR